MTRSTLPADASLPQVLADRARTASDGRLALDVAIGIVVAAAAVMFRPPGWVLLASAAGCFAAFGGWGIADRELAARSTSTSRPRVLQIVRILSAMIGSVCAVMLLGGVLFTALGTWIS